MTSFKSDRSHGAGKITHWIQKPHGLSGEAENANFNIQFYTPTVVRVTLTREKFFEDFSYSVTAKPGSVPFTLAETNDCLELRSGSLVININKNPWLITFLNLQGEIINQDDVFGISWNGEQVTTYKKLQEGELFIGLGEKTGPLDRRGKSYQNWNTDSYGYHSGTDPLYSSMPFYIGLHHGHAYGIFFDNTYKSFFSFGASNDRFSSFSADSGEMNYYFIHEESVAAIIGSYTHLTGRMKMPPRWSLGYQQCRYSYYPDKEVLQVAQTFRDKDIPADAIVLDIHYMEQYKIFTWSKKDFPDPEGLIRKLREMGFHVVLMCDPGIKIEPGYKTYDEGIAKAVFIQYPDGKYYAGQVWPGWCHFPDFTNPKTRSWWGDQFKDYVDIGVAGFWNDMNEIATWGHMLPEHINMDFEGHQSTMRRGRNIYGFQMARSTYEATAALMQGVRPFNLTRSGFSGVQRYAAMWTGDNVAYDEHMMLGVRMVNSMGLTGVAFAGYDVGGFVGESSTKLFIRWISIGAFSPFFRGHTMINTRDSEPWSYGEEAEQIARNYIKLRYKMMPYLYSLFYEASETGMPVQRSLAINFPFNKKIYDHQYQHQYTLGPFVLVAPVESDKEITKIYLPPGDWYSLYNGKKYTGECELLLECPIHRLPVFVQGSAIIPMQRDVIHTGEIADTMNLHLYQGTNPSSFLLYQDDGITFDNEKGIYSKRLIAYSPQEQKLTIHEATGLFDPGIKQWNVIFHGFSPFTKSLHVNGTKIESIHEINRFFSALEKFDPIYDPEPAPEENVQMISFEQNTKSIQITW